MDRDGRTGPRDGKSAEISDKVNSTSPSVRPSTGLGSRCLETSSLRHSMQTPAGPGPRSTNLSSPVCNRPSFPQWTGVAPDDDPPTVLDLTGLPPTPAEVEAFVSTLRRSPTKTSSSGCWRRRILANAGASTGSTSCGLPRRAGTRRITPSHRPIATATTSYAPSTPTCRTMTLSWNTSPGTWSSSRASTQPPARMNRRRGLFGISARRPIRRWTFVATSNRVHNQIDVYSKAFLGLTMGCARCHDHKFDAISTADYYAFAGYLQSSGYHLKDVATRSRRTVPTKNWPSSVRKMRPGS